VAALINRQIEGLIVIPCRDDSPALSDLRSSKIPIILVDRVGQDNRFDSVSANNAEASREGTQYLISLGHRRITLLASDAGLRNIKERIEGYREALLSANLSKFEQIVMAGRNDVESVKGALEPILLKRPRSSAVFAATQNMTGSSLSCYRNCRYVFGGTDSRLCTDGQSLPSADWNSTGQSQLELSSGSMSPTRFFGPT
jgi:DNA-binding LacI/PurR family transcriptional regulator